MESARYRLRPLWPLFASMFAEDGGDLETDGHLYARRTGYVRTVDRFRRIVRRVTLRPELTFRGYGGAKVDIYRALRGRVGGRDKAHFPWGQDLDEHRFLDPAIAVLAYEDTGRVPHGHDRISCEYLYNPYLSWVLGQPLDSEALIVPRFSRTRGSWIQGAGRRCAESLR